MKKPGSRFIRSAILVLVVATIMAVSIAWRVADRPDAPGLVPILLWQLLVWLPWIAFLPAATRVSTKYPATANLTAINNIVHLIAAALIATTHLVWFWQVSRFTSPLLGLPETKYGAYAFFFVFWFLIDLMLYSAIALMTSANKPEVARESLAETSEQKPVRTQFTVRKGHERHIVRVKEIKWVEAQGYYAALHTNSGSFLIRKSLTQLEGELDPERFVRVHRSTIVNIDNIEKLRSNDRGVTTVTLASGDRRRVSRAGRARLKSRFESQQGVR